VVTIGGKINLLGIVSFVMIILAVYTANLAAILTQEAQTTGVDGLEAALRMDYNFCVERKIAPILLETYGVDPSRIVPAPEDGEPGFYARTQVFERMRHKHTDGTLHCNAAIALLEDLEVLHSRGEHCDKIQIGESIAYAINGIPIFEKKAPELSALFHQAKFHGYLHRNLLAATPQSQCPVEGGEGTALDVQQLTGVWVIAFSFALFGLVLKCYFSSRVLSWRHRKEEDRPRRLLRPDQWLNPPSYDVIIDGFCYGAENNRISEHKHSNPASEGNGEKILSYSEAFKLDDIEEAYEEAQALEGFTAFFDCETPNDLKFEGDSESARVSS
jgi:hypothetical protein